MSVCISVKLRKPKWITRHGNSSSDAFQYFEIHGVSLSLAQNTKAVKSRSRLVSKFYFGLFCALTAFLVWVMLIPRADMVLNQPESRLFSVAYKTHTHIHMHTQIMFRTNGKRGEKEHANQELYLSFCLFFIRHRQDSGNQTHAERSFL